MGIMWTPNVEQISRNLKDQGAKIILLDRQKRITSSKIYFSLLESNYLQMLLENRDNHCFPSFNFGLILLLILLTIEMKLKPLLHIKTDGFSQHKIKKV